MLIEHFSKFETKVKTGIISVCDLVKYTDRQEIINHILKPFMNIHSSNRSLLILDNIDVIFEGQGRINVDNGFLKYSIMEAIDQIKRNSKHHPPIILALCNDAAKLTPDILNVGKFEKKIYMYPPSSKQRKVILQYLFATLVCEDRQVDARKHGLSFWIEKVVPRTVGFTAADLKQICRNALVRAASRSLIFPFSREISIDNFRSMNLKVTWQDIKSGMQDVIPSQLEMFDVLPPRIEYGEKVWHTFVGYRAVKSRLHRAVINPWLHLEKVEKEGASSVPPPSGVIFHGPSGCGKSEAAHCLSSALGACVIQVKASDVLDKWLGGSEAAIRKIFSRARATSPCVIIFDDIDALACNRNNTSGSDVHSRILSTLLNEMDGVSNRVNQREVLVIGATNRFDAIDSALLRPGRLQEHIFISYPSIDDCLDLLQFYTKKIPINNSVSLRKLAEIFVEKQSNGSDIKNVCRDACLHAWRQNSEGDIKSSIDMDDFTAVLS